MSDTTPDPLVGLMDSVDSMRARRDAGPAHRELGRLDGPSRATGLYAAQPGSHRASTDPEPALSLIHNVMQGIVDSYTELPRSVSR